MGAACQGCGGTGSAFNPCKTCGAGVGERAAPPGVEPSLGALVAEGRQPADEGPSKAELLEKAKELGIAGAARMSKTALAEAIEETLAAEADEQPQD